MVIRRHLGWTFVVAPRPWASVLLVFALIAAGCSSDEELSAGDAATVAPGSQAAYSVDGGDWVAVAEGDVIPDGAAVRAAGAEARLVFRDGAIRLRRDASAVVTAASVRVDRGEALIFSRGGLHGEAADATVRGAGRYRLASGLAARVGVYEGTVTVRRPAQEHEVPALRELDLSTFRLADDEPLHYSEADPWDQELLGPAIAFDGEAARLTRGMDVDLGRRPLRPGFYRQFAQPEVVDVLAARASVSRKGAFGPPSAVLFTVFVAEAAAGEAVAPAVRSVTDLRSAGARWGLIALELEVASEQVVAAIDDLDGGRIAAAEGAARGPAGGNDGQDVAVAADGGTSAPTNASTDGTAGETTPSDQPSGADPGDDDPGNDPGGRDPGDRDPGGTDPEEPTEGPSEPDDPTLEESVEKVVNDIVGGAPGDPEGDDGLDIPDLPLP